MCGIVSDLKERKEEIVSVIRLQGEIQPGSPQLDERRAEQLDKRVVRRVGVSVERMLYLGQHAFLDSRHDMAAPL